jgi:hypothetical protein
VRAAVTEHLVTRYTSAVGVMLQANPLDPYAVSAYYLCMSYAMHQCLLGQHNVCWPAGIYPS